MKLYPPYIEGTIPAFYEDSKGTVKLTVPFSMNRAVGANEVGGFQAKIKTVQSNTYLMTLRTDDHAQFDVEENYEVEFILSEAEANKLLVGEFYKVQIAYISKDKTIGYYSTVGVVKYTTKPVVRIDTLVQYVPNAHDYIYTGLYRQYELDSNGVNIKDTTEKEYSYQFIITDKAGNIIDDTGIKIHNCENDVETYESVDEYKYNSDIPENMIYYLQYIVHTNNKMTIKSPKYKIVQKKSIPPEIEAQIVATMNFDNGYIDVHLIGDKDRDGYEKATTGAFVITRACSDSHFQTWNEVFRFTLHGQQPSLKLLRDYTIEQGKEYIYALQQYNDFGLYSSRLLSNAVMADFEDIFIYDGQKQLKVKYNPKVSSFKTNILETKIDTIGTKFPFIFRNGRVEYKEFPVSGLISYLADDMNLFITDDELGLTEGYANVKRPGTLRKDITSKDDEYFWTFNHPTISANEMREKYKKQEAIEELMQNAKPRTTQLVDYNVSAERVFKLAVLNWLNDGRIKLFRSPSEGNYLVRLMNVSLTPEDRVSRMIHNFQATAYEMMDCTYDNMTASGIITVHQEDMTQLRWESLELATDIDPQDTRYVKVGNIWYLRGNILTQHHGAANVRFNGLAPGSDVGVRIRGQDMETIRIGVTGSYEVDTGMDIDIIKIPDDAQYQGIVTYGYYNDAQNVFNTVAMVDVADYLGQQFIGEQSNIIDQINNVKFTLLKFFYLHFDKRYIEDYETVAPLLTTINDSSISEDGKRQTKRLINEFPLYLERVEYININGVTIYGLERVDNEIVLRDLVVSPDSPNTRIVSNKYYYLEGGIPSQRTRVYFENQKYYIKKPLNIYHDFSTKDKNKIIVDKWYIDQETYDRIKIAYPNANLSGVELVSYKISVDGHILDLDEIEKFDIDENIIFDSIELDNGASLECGYQLQEITYSVEQLYEVENSFLKNYYTEYMYYLSPQYYYSLRDNEISDDTYTQNTEEARGLMINYNLAAQYRGGLPVIYSKYMELIEQKKLEWEESGQYE